MQEKRPLYPIPDFADRNNYHYIPKDEVTKMLEDFGLGPSKRMVHAAYISPDKETIVGVLHVTEDKDHLIDDPIFQGVLGLEAMAQTWIILKTVNGELTPDKTARFEGLEQVRFRHSIYPNVDVNIVVRELPESNSTYGQILVGKTIVTEGLLNATIMDKESASTNGERRKKIQANSQILFPIKE